MKPEELVAIVHPSPEEPAGHVLHGVDAFQTLARFLASGGVHTGMGQEMAGKMYQDLQEFANEHLPKETTKWEALRCAIDGIQKCAAGNLALELDRFLYPPKTPTGGKLRANDARFRLLACLMMARTCAEELAEDERRGSG